MFFTRFALGALFSASLISASGFTTYKQITEGADNSGAVTYQAPSKSKTVWVYVQILPNGGDHTSLWNDFKTLATNYASHGISVIPRVRYGTSDGNMATEPNDANIIARDVQAWTSLLNSTKSSVTYPIVQAGFLGQWGEWHDGPFCQAKGKASSAASLAVKKDILNQLQATGLKVALRYPIDHGALVGSRSTKVTLHDDCIFAEGPGGPDTGTFTDGDGHDAAYWMSYTKTVAGDNGYGGEGCQTTYDWSDYSQLCGSNGIIKYINDYKMAYLNPLNPGAMGKLIQDSSINATCAQAIQTALESHKM